MLDQPSRFAENARAYIKRVTEAVTGLTRAGKLISKPDDYFIPFDAAMRRLSAMALYMADSFTTGRYPAEPRSVTVIRAKQLPSYAGSATQAADDITGYLKAGVSVVVLSGDIRRAKLLAEFLNEHGIKCSSVREPHGPAKARRMRHNDRQACRPGWSTRVYAWPC